MLVLVASDLHGKPRAKETLNQAFRKFREELDLVILCGDITTFASPKKTRKVLESLEAPCPILAVPGNCDEPQSYQAFEDSKVIMLHGKTFEHKGHIFVGYGGAPCRDFGDVFNQQAAGVLEKLLKGKDPSRLHLVLHAPVRGYVDAGHGNPVFRDLVDRYHPSSVFSGHMHKAKGTARNEHTFFLNPGPAAGGHYSVVETKAEGVELVFDI